MFEMLSKAGGDLARATRQATIRASIELLSAELRALPCVLPEMSAVQRCQIKLALGQAVAAIHEAELQIEAVQRVALAQADRAARAEHGCTASEEAAGA